MEETKLEKRLSPLNVWALAFGCIIGWGAFVMPGDTFLCKAGPLGTAVGMLVAAGIMMIIAINYHFMVNKYPISGGEFAYARNAFGRNHAFVCAWFLGLSYATLVPMNSTALALVGRNLLGGVFQIGFHYKVAEYDVYLGEILLALCAIVLFGVLSIRGVKFAGSFQVLLTGALIAGVSVIGVAALVSPEASWTNLQPGYYPDIPPVSGVMSILAVAPWAFVGFDTVPQAAEEFQFSPRKTRSIMVVSILFGALVYIVLNTVTAATIPERYGSWVEYINAVPKLNGIESLPTFHAAYELLGTAGLVFLGIAVLAAILAGIIGFYMATSRLLYALARDNILPKWFGVLDPVHKTPRNAILFHMVLSLIAPFFGRTALGWLVDMSSLGAAIGYGYTSAAAAWFAKKEGNKAVLFTGVLGMVMSAIFALLLLVPFPGLNCSLGKESYFCLVVWCLLGLLFYLRVRTPDNSHR